MLWPARTSLGLWPGDFLCGRPVRRRRQGNRLSSSRTRARNANENFRGGDVPTDRKLKGVEDIQKLLETCTAAIVADYTGLKVDAMTTLRRTLRQRGVTFRVVKNTITYLAADAAGKPAVKDIVQGPTGIAFGFEDPVEPAKALAEFISSTRSTLKIRGGILEDRALSAGEVASLAALPSKDQLIANLLGQLQAPITSLAYVLNAPVASLARVIQRRIEQAGAQDGE